MNISGHMPYQHQIYVGYDTSRKLLGYVLNTSLKHPDSFYNYPKGKFCYFQVLDLLILDEMDKWLSVLLYVNHIKHQIRIYKVKMMVLLHLPKNWAIFSTFVKYYVATDSLFYDEQISDSTNYISPLTIDTHFFYFNNIHNQPHVCAKNMTFRGSETMALKRKKNPMCWPHPQI